MPYLDIELENYDSVYRQYSWALLKVSDICQEFTKAVFKPLENSSEESTHYSSLVLDTLSKKKFFVNVKYIVKDLPHLQQTVKNLLCEMLFRLLTHLESPEFRHTFSSTYYHILQGDTSHGVIVNMEKALVCLKDCKSLNKVHPASVDILLDFALAAFETLFDGEIRKQAFVILNSLMFIDGTKSAKFVFEFIMKNMNDLRYSETPQMLKSLLEY